jgi:hypothetical protein
MAGTRQRTAACCVCCSAKRRSTLCSRERVDALRANIDAWWERIDGTGFPVV